MRSNEHALDFWSEAVVLLSKQREHSLTPAESLQLRSRLILTLHQPAFLPLQRSPQYLRAACRLLRHQAHQIECTAEQADHLDVVQNLLEKTGGQIDLLFLLLTYYEAFASNWQPAHLECLLALSLSTPARHTKCIHRSLARLLTSLLQKRKFRQSQDCAILLHSKAFDIWLHLAASGDIKLPEVNQLLDYVHSDADRREHSDADRSDPVGVWVADDREEVGMSTLGVVLEDDGASVALAGGKATCLWDS